MNGENQRHDLTDMTNFILVAFSGTGTFEIGQIGLHGWILEKSPLFHVEVIFYKDSVQMSTSVYRLFVKNSDF